MSGPDPAPYIAVTNVRKVYGSDDGDVEAIANISFDVPRGQFLSIVGPSGCGKSTLLLAIAGLTKVTSGEIRIDGLRITDAYTKLGIVFQNPELLPWRTTVGNVLLQAEVRKIPAEVARREAKGLLGRVGLGGFEDRYPQELSGGMAQRVAMCRALLHDPDLLVMDEPFGALDALTRDRVNLDLQSLWLERGKTALFVTHSIEEAVFLSDRVIVMSPRPSQLAADVWIDLSRPRRLSSRSDPEFNAYVRQIRDLFASLGVYGWDAA